MTRPKSPRQREREAIMTAWLLEKAKKSRGQTRIAGGTPLWLRAAVTREGDFLVTKCCIVANADVHPFEVRIDMRRLAATLKKLHALGHLKMPPGSDTVSGFGSFLKKAAKAITKNKVTKAVGSVVKKVVSNPIVQIANPMAAITAHTISKAATGKGTIKGPAGKIVDLGAAVAAPAGLAHVSPKAIAALGLGAKTVMATKVGPLVALAAKNAQGAIRAGQNAAAALKAGKISATVAAPLVKKALAVRGTVTKVAPTLAAKAKLSKDVKKSLISIAAKARTGNPDARYTAAVIARTAKMTDDIARAQQAAGGGNPGFVITATGKIRRAPKGKFIQQASLPIIETLYRGATTSALKGSFAAVSGTRTRAEEIAHAARGEIAAAGVMRAPVGPIAARAAQRLIALESRGGASKSETAAAFAMIQRAVAKYGRDSISGMHDQGPSWGGYDDPADEYEGPLTPIHREEIAGVFTP